MDGVREGGRTGRARALRVQAEKSTHSSLSNLTSPDTSRPYEESRSSTWTSQRPSNAQSQRRTHCRVTRPPEAVQDDFCALLAKGVLPLGPLLPPTPRSSAVLAAKLRHNGLLARLQLQLDQLAPHHLPHFERYASGTSTLHPRPNCPERASVKSEREKVEREERWEELGVSVGGDVELEGGDL